MRETNNDPLVALRAFRALRLLVAFAATHTPNGALNAEGALYDEAGLGDRNALAVAVAEARCDLRDLADLLVAARAVDAALAVSYVGPHKRGYVAPALREAWSKLLDALGPDGIAVPRCADENCDGGCAGPGREPGGAS